MTVTTTFIQTEIFNVIDCPDCGMLFAITNQFENRKRKDGKSFYCPAGHSMSYSESEADRLRKQLNQSKGDLATAQLEIMVAEKKIKRLETRIKNGACPCCHRQFVNLQKHMNNQHPEFRTPK